MPVPILLAGLGVGAALLGAGGHLSAKETNERAQSLSEDARELYNNAKSSLEKAQGVTEKSLLKLGYSKKNVLDTSMKQFLNSYDKIKTVVVKESVGLNEISNFTIDQQDAIQLREMTDIYSSSVSSGATGAAAGAIVALAASGDLLLVTDGLALAGSALAAGEIGAAAGIAGSALSFGAAMTPLAAVAAPVVLFTGISASIKADENLEKAQTMYAEAEAASEKMKVSETLCNAISERADMFDETLTELNGLFSRCTNLLDEVIRKKEGRFFKKTLTSADFSENDLQLIAVARSLAGAVKAIIDTPILNNEGGIAYESQEVYDATVKELPDFSRAVVEVESLDYSNSNVKAQMRSQDITTPKMVEQNNTAAGNASTGAYNPPGILKFFMWLLSVWFVISGVCMVFAGAIIPGIIVTIGSIQMCPKVKISLKFLPRLGILFLSMIVASFFM